MRRPRLRRRDPAAAAEIVGVARVDRRTKDLVKRLEPGEIAVINHQDLDRVAADGLADAACGAVVNAAASISGRYPNGGPRRLIDAGVPLIDRRRGDLLERVHEGDQLRIVGGEVWRGFELLTTGQVLERDGVEAEMEEARSSIGGELERFAVNTLEYVREKRASPSSRSSFLRSRPSSQRAMRSSSSVDTTTRAILRRFAPTSASTAQRSSGSTAGPMRCSRSG